MTPKEGQIVWHDNMVIPRQAQNALERVGVDELLLHAEDRRHRRGLGELRLPGARGAQQYILNVIKDPTRRQQPAGLPAAAADKLSHSYYIYRDYDEYQAWNDVYNPIIES